MDTVGISIIIVIATFVSALGLALDKLVLPRQAKVLEDRLLKLWNFADELKFRDIAVSMIRLFVKLEEKIFGHIFSLNWIIRVTLVSVFLTFFVIFFGRAFGLYFTGFCYGVLSGSENMIPLKHAFRASYSYISNNTKIAYIISTNLLADQLTLAITLLLTRAYVKAPKSIARYSFLILDILTCFFIFITAYYFISKFDGLTAGNLNSIFSVPSELAQGFASYNCSGFHMIMSSLLLTSTITLPTLIYLSMIMLCMLLKSSLEIGRKILLQLTDLGVTGEKTIFFYTGIFISLIVISSKMTLEVFKLF